MIGDRKVEILSVTAYERLLKGQPNSEWKHLVDQARTQIRSELGGRELPPAEEILSRVREERDAQLMDLR